MGNESEGNPEEMKRLRGDGDRQAAVKTMKVRTTRRAV